MAAPAGGEEGCARSGWVQLGTGILAEAVFASCVASHPAMSLLQTIHGPTQRATLKTSHSYCMATHKHVHTFGKNSARMF